MDLCGPMRVQSINGKRYILIIVDDFSRWTWVYFLRSKDQVPSMIITFLTKIQVQLRNTVRMVRTDNGTDKVVLSHIINSEEIPVKVFPGSCPNEV